VRDGTYRFSHADVVRTPGGSGFRVKCSKCERTETIQMNRDHTLPPEIVKKKFTIMQWHIDRNPAFDLCPDHAIPTKKREANNRNASPSEPDPTAQGMSLMMSIRGGLARLAKTDQSILRALRESLGPEDPREQDDPQLWATQVLRVCLNKVIRSHEAPPVVPQAEPPPPPPQGIPQAAIDRARASLGLPRKETTR
jgi:hypothetical protein